MHWLNWLPLNHFPVKTDLKHCFIDEWRFRVQIRGDGKRSESFALNPAKKKETSMPFSVSRSTEVNGSFMWPKHGDFICKEAASAPDHPN